MGNHEILGEGRRHAFDQLMNRQRRGVGGDDRAGFARAVDFFIDVLFDFEFFEYGFDDPVAFLEFSEIVFKIAAGDALGVFFMGKAGRRLVAASCFSTPFSVSILRFFSPGLTMSSSSTWNPALAQCAAMPLPMTPEPSTAIFLMSVMSKPFCYYVE